MNLCKKKDPSLQEADDPEETGEFFVWRCAKRMAQANDPVFAGAGDPLWVSDGDLSIPPAMLAVFGQPIEEPVHRGPRWKYPRLEPDENILFARAIKSRDDSGRLLGTKEGVAWDDPDAVWQRIDPEGGGRHISTFCVEREYLTSRLHNSRLVSLEYLRLQCLLGGVFFSRLDHPFLNHRSGIKCVVFTWDISNPGGRWLHQRCG